MSNEETFLVRAIELATQSVADGGGPFGAVVVQGGAIVAEGQNRVTLAPDPTAHAEVVAIRRAAQARQTHDLAGCVLFASCEPCPMCLAAIHWARIDRVVYAADRLAAAAAGFDDELLYEEFKRPANERVVPSAHVPHVARAQPFEAWSQRDDRTPY